MRHCFMSSKKYVGGGSNYLHRLYLIIVDSGLEDIEVI